MFTASSSQIKALVIECFPKYFTDYPFHIASEIKWQPCLGYQLQPQERFNNSGVRHSKRRPGMQVEVM